MLHKIHSLLLILCVGAIQCSEQSSQQLTDIINDELLRVPASPTPDFILIKHSLGLYVTGMELNLRLREAPILSALRLRVPDSWLNKFSEENPHLLKYLIQTLFKCLKGDGKIDETLYAITKKFVNRVEHYKSYSQSLNQELHKCVNLFRKFDELVQHMKEQHIQIKRQATRHPKTSTMNQYKEEMKEKYGNGSNGGSISTALYQSGFQGMQNIMSYDPVNSDHMKQPGTSGNDNGNQRQSPEPPRQ